jgi:hypothetical protein
MKNITLIAIVLLVIAAFLSVTSVQSPAYADNGGTSVKSTHGMSATSTETADKPARSESSARGYSAGCIEYDYKFVLHGFTQHMKHGTNCQATAQKPAETRGEAEKPIVETVEPTEETPVDVVCEVEPTEEKPADKPATTGNPGNLKAVGHAGENPNGRDTMPLDDPQGINGEHGNQGTNPNAGGENSHNPHN